MTTQSARKAKELVEEVGIDAALDYSSYIQELHLNQKDFAEASFWSEVVNAIKSENQITT